MSHIYKTESDAKKKFRNVSVEQCEKCGRWSASKADHEHGGIIGPWCTENGKENVYDRICSDCENKSY